MGIEQRLSVAIGIKGVNSVTKGFDSITAHSKTAKKSLEEYNNVFTKLIHTGNVNENQTFLQNLATPIKEAEGSVNRLYKGMLKIGTLNLKTSNIQMGTGQMITASNLDLMKRLNSEFRILAMDRIKAARRQLLPFRAELLSTLFMGMQVWRTFGGFFKSLIENYKKLDEKGNKPLTRALTKLSASFTYLKFSILDAMGPSLTILIIKLAEAMLWLADINPKILAEIGYAIGIIGATGLAGFVGSQVGLFADAVQNIVTLGKSGKPGVLKDIAKSIREISIALASIKGVAFLTALGALLLGFESLGKVPGAMEEFKSIWSDIGSAVTDQINIFLDAIGNSFQFKDIWELIAGVFIWVSSVFGILTMAFIDGLSGAILGVKAFYSIILKFQTDALLPLYKLMLKVSEGWLWLKEELGFDTTSARKEINKLKDVLDEFDNFTENFTENLYADSLKGFEDYITGPNWMESPEAMKLWDNVFKGPVGIIDELRTNEAAALDALRMQERAEGFNELLSMPIEKRIELVPFVREGLDWWDSTHPQSIPYDLTKSSNRLASSAQQVSY